MNDHRPSTRRFSRRGILTTAAGGISALALHHAFFGRSALAAPKQGRLSAKQSGDVKAQVPKGRDETPSDTKLTPEQTRLARLLLQKTKHAIAQAAAHPKEKFQTETIHFTAAGLFASVSRTRADRAKQRAAKLLAEPKATQELNFGVYAKAELTAATVKQAPDLEIVAAIRELNEAEKKRSKPKENDAAVYSKIEFQLNSVECLEETSDGPGSDEILLGGQLISANGSIKSIDQFKVSDDFDKGEMKFYDFEPCDAMTNHGQVDLPGFLDQSAFCPHGSLKDVYRGRVLASANLVPGTYGLVLVMAEQDDGGFKDILEKIYKAVKKEVDAAIEAAGTAIGGAIGSFIPIPGLGTAIGAVLGWLAGKLIEWFLSLFDNKDDLVASKSWMVTFKNTTQSHIDAITKDDHLPTPKGTRAGAMKKMTMKGDDGKYEVRLHWRALAT